MQTDKDGIILIVEDESEVRRYLEMAVRCQGFSVELAENGEEALAYLRTGVSVKAVLLDIEMPRKNGTATLREIRSLNKDLPVIMVSGSSSPLTVVEAVKNGASDFLGKPIDHEELRVALTKALKSWPASSAPVRPATPSTKYGVFGVSARMRELESVVAQIGGSEAPVLIQGETGAGKEVLARQLHALSPRAGKPFLKLNCAALPSELVESELFGYERGAFTGAFQKKAGMFELADGGTLLLDEIGDMEYKLQAKLLQVLQDHEFQRLGGKETTRVDVRIIAATHNDLEKSIIDKTFRQDLYYRLNVINLHVPALRERKEDIIELAEYLLRKHAAPNRPAPALTTNLKQALIQHNWPGNVRELENVIRKFGILGNADVIAGELLSHASRKTLASPGNSTEIVTPPILEQVTQAKISAEIEAIRAALQTTNWNRKQAARLLKIDYKAFLYKMKKLGIEDELSYSPALQTRTTLMLEHTETAAAATNGGTSA
jgi:two-component system response regulator AtoC